MNIHFVVCLWSPLDGQSAMSVRIWKMTYKLIDLEIGDETVKAFHIQNILYNIFILFFSCDNNDGNVYREKDKKKKKNIIYSRESRAKKKRLNWQHIKEERKRSRYSVKDVKNVGLRKWNDKRITKSIFYFILFFWLILSKCKIARTCE